MICKNCNKEVSDNSKFCEYCGAKLEGVQLSKPNAQPAMQGNAGQPNGTPESATTNAGQPNGSPVFTATNPSQQSGPVPYPQQAYQPPRPPRKPIDKRIIIAIAAAVCVFILIIVLIVTHKKKMDLADYTTVTFTGYDSYGTAAIDFDEEAFLSDLQKNAKNIGKGSSKNISDSDYSWSDLVSDFGDAAGYVVICQDLDWSLDKSTELSNGDKVTVSFEYNNEIAKKYGIKFVGKDKEFTVSGLEEIKEVDPFADLTVSFSGTAPNAYAEIQNNSKDEVVSNLYFTVEPNDGLSKGDTVTVTVNSDIDDLLQSYGCKLTATSKEFTCDSVDTYIMDSKDIGTDLLDQMKSETEDQIQAYFAENAESIQVSDLEYEGYYFLTAKDKDTWNYKNMIYVLYSGKVKSLEEEKQFKETTVYFPVRFAGAILYADGTGYVDLSNSGILGSTSLSYGWWGNVAGYENKNTLENELVTSQKGDYEECYVEK